MVANAGFYGSAATRAIGAIPWYCDVDPHTHNMDPKCLEAMLSRRGSAGSHHCYPLIWTTRAYVRAYGDSPKI